MGQHIGIFGKNTVRGVRLKDWMISQAQTINQSKQKRKKGKNQKEVAVGKTCLSRSGWCLNVGNDFTLRTHIDI